MISCPDNMDFHRRLTRVLDWLQVVMLKQTGATWIGSVAMGLTA